MENTTDNMEELKQQFSVLTNKINSEQINNELLLREVMKSKMKWLERYAYFQIFMAVPVSALCWLFVSWMEMISLPMALAAIILIIASSYLEIRINKVMTKGWLEKDLLSSRITLLNMKKARAKQMFYSIPVQIIFFGALIYDFYVHLLNDSAVFFGMVIASIIGAIIGGILGYTFYRKAQHTNDELIQQIDRFRN